MREMDRGAWSPLDESMCIVCAIYNIFMKDEVITCIVYQPSAVTPTHNSTTHHPTHTHPSVVTPVKSKCLPTAKFEFQVIYYIIKIKNKYLPTVRFVPRVFTIKK